VSVINTYVLFYNNFVEDLYMYTVTTVQFNPLSGCLSLEGGRMSCANT
jgi:hypothetical protein